MDGLTFRQKIKAASLYTDSNDCVGFMRMEERPYSTTAVLCNEAYDSKQHQQQMTPKYINLANIEPPYRHRVTFNFPRCLR